MHRLLVGTAELSREVPQLTREARTHLKVLRPKNGENVELFDGRGSWRVYRFGSFGDACFAPCGPVMRETRKSTRRLTLFACVTKGSRWDWTIEKATELGVSCIVPVISDRTIVRIAPDERAAKCERWRRIAEDAARQSDAKWLPEIVAPVDFADSLALVRACTCYVGALMTPPPQTIGEVLRAAGDARCAGDETHYAVYVGPEGDFTPAELEQLLAVATPVSFGSTVLRAETAAIYGISVLKSHLDALASSKS